MTEEKKKELIDWLYKELEQISAELKSARQAKSYTNEAQCEGKADAIIRMIKKIKGETGRSLI